MSLHLSSLSRIFSFISHGDGVCFQLLCLWKSVLEIRFAANSYALVVSVSGVTPEDPVVSRKSGLLFERRLILKHLAVMLDVSCDFVAVPFHVFCC